MEKKGINQSYENIACYYDDIYKVEPNETEKEIKALLALLKKNNVNISDSIVADIGAGTGRLAIPLSNICKKIIFIEPFEEMIKVAKEKAKNQEYGDIEYFQEGFLNISLPPVSVDVAISFGGAFAYLLEVNEQITALKSLFEILRPGGFVVFDVINFFSLIKSYQLPKPMEWETILHKFKRTITHENDAFHEIWIHKEKIIVTEKATGIVKEINAIHRLKMISPTELMLLFMQTGFEKIEICSGSNPSTKDGRRIWIVAKKQN